MVEEEEQSGASRGAFLLAGGDCGGGGGLKQRRRGGRGRERGNERADHLLHQEQHARRPAMLRSRRPLAGRHLSHADCAERRMMLLFV